MASLLLRAAALVAVVACLAPSAHAQTKCTATLKGWSMLPTKTYVAPPNNAPPNYKVSAKFTTGGAFPFRRTEALGTIPSCAGAANPTRCTDIAAPLTNQPVQGFSGIKTERYATSGKPTGRYYIITDNGFGSKKNSPDSLLMVHQISPNWQTQAVTRLKTIFLSDPNKVIPFLIVNEATPRRYMTGADLDIESIQVVNGSFWIGDELGPYLIEFSASSGVAKAIYDVPHPSGAGFVKSPDHDSLTLPNPDGGLPAYNIKRSRGFEGMALDPQGTYLYPLLEGPIWDPVAKSYEKVNGAEVLRIFKFNLLTRSWEPSSFKFPVEAAGNSIGDFNMITQDIGLIIEREGGEGDSRFACSAGVPTNSSCFENPAKLKRVWVINLARADANGLLPKSQYIDLLDIQDPSGVSAYSYNGVFKFPFTTIENVDWVELPSYSKGKLAKNGTIIVGNDNNHPYSMGRNFGKNDDNELILLELPPSVFVNGTC